MHEFLKHMVGSKGADLPSPVYLYLWITTMLNEGIEMSTVAYLAETSVRMIMKYYYEPHSADRARASEMLPAF
ncbi:protein of unknown function [Maridesulfovibrio hydrothermalis AM13 = DSM 14728]|uniref:Uncharacterized protein n=1 Tax=Maridesulfovibrio hydrothermalis AM13 = DSM 14728 TaxID=1121451 RepID=L0RH43_9BACT|nr:protein of unknown function [Maridesulfovibrio hydrothermalis AM13 = DSM 14728]